MTWTRLSDDFADSPAVLGLSDAAFRCHVTALIWSNRQLTDGRVPLQAIRLFGAAPEAVAELIAAELWTAEEDGYQLDWADQESKATVEARAKDNAKRQQRHRLHRTGDHSLCDYCAVTKAHDAGDHSTCVAEFCGEAGGSSDASSNALRNASVTPLVTPLPTRAPSPSPTPREGEERGARGERSAEAAEPSAGAPVSAPSTDLEAGSVEARAFKNFLRGREAAASR